MQLVWLQYATAADAAVKTVHIIKHPLILFQKSNCADSYGNRSPGQENACYEQGLFGGHEETLGLFQTSGQCPESKTTTPGPWGGRSRQVKLST